MRNSHVYDAVSLKKTLTVIAMTALCLATVWPIKRGVFFNAKKADNLEAAYEIARQIRYSFTIQNTTNQLIENAVFRAWAPTKQTPTQLCKGIDASDPFEILADDLGNQVLEFELHDFPPYGSRIISITADLMMSSIPNRTTAADLQLMKDSQNFIVMRIMTFAPDQPDERFNRFRIEGRGLKGRMNS